MRCLVCGEASSQDDLPKWSFQENPDNCNEYYCYQIPEQNFCDLRLSLSSDSMDVIVSIYNLLATYVHMSTAISSASV